MKKIAFLSGEGHLAVCTPLTGKESWKAEVGGHGDSFVHSNCLNPEPPYQRGLLEQDSGGFNPPVKCSSKPYYAQP